MSGLWVTYLKLILQIELEMIQKTPKESKIQQHNIKRLQNTIFRQKLLSEESVAQNRENNVVFALNPIFIVIVLWSNVSCIVKF